MLYKPVNFQERSKFEKSLRNSTLPAGDPWLPSAPRSVTVVTQSSTKYFSMRNRRKTVWTQSPAKSPVTKPTREVLLKSRKTTLQAVPTKSCATKEPRGPDLSYPVWNSQFGCPVITCPMHFECSWGNKRAAYMHYLRHHSNSTSLALWLISC